MLTLIVWGLRLLLSDLILAAINFMYWLLATFHIPDQELFELLDALTVLMEKAICG